MECWLLAAISISAVQLLPIPLPQPPLPDNSSICSLPHAVMAAEAAVSLLETILDKGSHIPLYRIGPQEEPLILTCHRLVADLIETTLPHVISRTTCHTGSVSNTGTPYRPKTYTNSNYLHLARCWRVWVRLLPAFSLPPNPTIPHGHAALAERGLFRYILDPTLVDTSGTPHTYSPSLLTHVLLILYKAKQVRLPAHSLTRITQTHISIDTSIHTSTRT